MIVRDLIEALQQKPWDAPVVIRLVRHRRFEERPEEVDYEAYVLDGGPSSAEPVALVTERFFG